METLADPDFKFLALKAAAAAEVTAAVYFSCFGFGRLHAKLIKLGRRYHPR